jgi:hypothetical protein
LHKGPTNKAVEKPLDLGGRAGTHGVLQTKALVGGIQQVPTAPTSGSWFFDSITFAIALSNFDVMFASNQLRRDKGPSRMEGA